MPAGEETGIAGDCTLGVLACGAGIAEGLVLKGVGPPLLTGPGLAGTGEGGLGPLDP